MTKQLTCPVCGKKKWCRDDAKTCSSNCRVKLWRDNKKYDQFDSVTVELYGATDVYLRFQKGKGGIK